MVAYKDILMPGGRKNGQKRSPDGKDGGKVRGGGIGAVEDKN